MANSPSKYGPKNQPETYSNNDGDFNINLAGKNAGSLYGRGVYFAENCTKSDEYSDESSKYGAASSNSLNPMLICRVLLGRVNYCDDIYPDPQRLVSGCVLEQ